MRNEESFSEMMDRLRIEGEEIAQDPDLIFMGTPTPPRLARRIKIGDLIGLSDRVDRLESGLTNLRSDYDNHLIFGKWGSMIAMAIFLVIFAAQTAAIVWLIHKLG